MLIQINTCIQTSILATTQDFIVVQNFYYRWKLWKNAITFGADVSSSLQVDNKGKDISIIVEGPMQGLDGTMLKAEAKYPINFSQ